ncbi:MAG: hypothetical protein JO040_07085 [Gemmatimonadetes bacterium]|nr:hypothetical protein [Gemmatimonadota bacterium]
MHGKLKLSLDDLRVETFETTAGSGSAAGTVHALDCDLSQCVGCSACTGCTDCTNCTGCSACSTQSYQVETGCFYTCYDFVTGGGGPCQAATYY